MDRQQYSGVPYWQPGPGQYPRVKDEPDYSKMGYEDSPGGGMGAPPPPFNIKQEPTTGPDAPPMGYSANVKIEPPEVKQEFIEPKREPLEERRGEKRQASNEYGPPDSKRYRPEAVKGQKDDDPEYDKEIVILDWYNSDLSLKIDTENFLSATPLTNVGFAYVWHGVRATYGYSRGRLFYEVKIEDHIKVPHAEGEMHPHVVRVGWSTDDAGLTLGEEQFSYGYGGTGKASTDLKFKDYGCTFGKGDVLGCFLDMDAEPIIMSFSVNGRNFGTCYNVSHRSLKGKALFPHILTKNCSFKVNFGTERWFEPAARYTYVGQVPLHERVQGTQGPQTRQESEVIMMVGLPACGKTTWVENYCRENPSKKYYVLGTNFLIDKMKVQGLPRKRNYHGRWDVLIDQCTKGLNQLLTMSYTRKRNYIIDQTNVYPSARRRKMKGFPGFYRRAVVIVPTDDTLRDRTAKQVNVEGKSVPDSAILEMKVNFTLPEVDEEIFDSVEYVELQQEEANALVEQYCKEAQAAGYVKKPAFRGGGRGGGNFRGGWNRDRNTNDNRGGQNRDGFGRGGRDSSNDRGGFGRDNRGGGFGRGGFGNRGGFDRGSDGGRGRFDRGGGDTNRGGRFDRGSDGARGGFDRRGDDNRGGYGCGADNSYGGFSRGGDSSRDGGFGRGNFGGRDNSRSLMDRDSQGFGNSSDNSYQSNRRDNERDSSRGYGGDRGTGGRDFERGSDTSRGSLAQDSNNFGRSRDSQRGFDTDRGNFGGSRFDSDRGGRDYNRGNDYSRDGGDNRNNMGGYNQDNSSGFSRDSQRSFDRNQDYNFGNLSTRSYSLDTGRSRDSLTSLDSGLGGFNRNMYGGNSSDGQRGFGSYDSGSTSDGQRGFGSYDSLSRNMGSVGRMGGGTDSRGGGSDSRGGYGSQDQIDSSGYSSLSSSSGNVSSSQNRPYNPQQQYWGQSDGGYGNQQGSGASQSQYGKSYDRSSSPAGGIGGSGGWGQGGASNYSGLGSSNPSWNYQGPRQ